MEKKTLEIIVGAAKCRKGKAVGISEHGAYWLACDPIVIRRAGADGIGQSAADITYYLELRHYRSGLVRPVVWRSAWHQNGVWGGSGDDYFSVPGLRNAGTIEDVAALLLRGVAGRTCYSVDCYSNLLLALGALGLPASEPGPDE